VQDENFHSVTPAAYVPEEVQIPTEDDAVSRHSSGVPLVHGARSAVAENGKRRDTSYPPAPRPLPVSVIDNHTHMDFRDGWVEVSVKDAMDAANAVGVKGAIQVGCDVKSSRWAVQAAESDPRVLAAVAIHPNDAPRLLHPESGHGHADESELSLEGFNNPLEAALAEIEKLAAHPRVRAIGETGLDYFRTGEEGRDAQRYSFERHIDIAVRAGKAMQIHDRDAHDDVVEVLTSGIKLPEKVVFHCYSGDEALAKICNEHGWYMSFAGTVSFKNSKNQQAALAIARKELILVETDAPFLTPHPFRGRPNAVYMVPYTVRFMAKHLGVDVEELCHQLTQNTEEVYGQFEG